MRRVDVQRKAAEQARGEEPAPTANQSWRAQVAHLEQVLVEEEEATTVPGHLGHLGHSFFETRAERRNGDGTRDVRASSIRRQGKKRLVLWLSRQTRKKKRRLRRFRIVLKAFTSEPTNIPGSRFRVL